jgi:O-antigen/teichoic acid export membrane protein
MVGLPGRRMNKIKSASSFKLDLSANFAGSGWTAVMQIVCIPLYIKFLGVEGYGLIGFYLMFQAMIQILDFGMTPTINREMARYSVQLDKASDARDFVRTLEVGYWLIGLIIGLVGLACAPMIATHWIKTRGIPDNDVRHAVMVMSMLAVLQWPFSFYEAGLIGLRRQVLVNALKVGIVTLSSGGAVLVLWLFSPTIKSFFLWQVGVSSLQTTLMAIFLWRSLPLSDHAPLINLKLLKNISGFAAGMTGITVSAMVLTQLDKIIISKLFSLEMFGYYVLAGTFGKAILMVVAPVFNTIFPRFSSLAALHDEQALSELYHRCTQLMAVLILPIAAILASFPFEILVFWTRNTEAALIAAPVARLLTIGTAVNGLMVLPYVLQLAHGWTSIGLRMNILLVITMVPAVWLLASNYGLVGGASGYLGAMFMYLAMGVPLTHRRLLRGAVRKWFTEDVGLTFGVVLLVVGGGRVAMSHLLPARSTMIVLPVIWIAAVTASALAAPEIRQQLFAKMSNINLRYV